MNNVILFIKVPTMFHTQTLIFQQSNIIHNGDQTIIKSFIKHIKKITKVKIGVHI